MWYAILSRERGNNLQVSATVSHLANVNLTIYLKKKFCWANGTKHFSTQLTDMTVPKEPVVNSYLCKNMLISKWISQIEVFIHMDEPDVQEFLESHTRLTDFKT